MALDRYADATYPVTVMTPRSVDNLPNMSFDSEKAKVLFAEDIARVNNEVVSVETTLGVSPQGSHTTVAARIAAAEELIAAMIGRVYPVGSQYVNFTDSTNPETLLGVGTWALEAKGRVVVGYDATQTEFNAAKKTGGSKTHTLTVNEMPVHSHSIGHVNHSVGGFGASGLPAWATYLHNEDWTSSGAIPELSGVGYPRTSNQGSGQAHNNLQPYLVAYIWRRTA